jgi:site-specific recombinase XerD
MTALAPTLQSFFTDYLIGQRGASGHTITAYRDTLRLLLSYVHERTGIQPADLDLTVWTLISWPTSSPCSGSGGATAPEPATPG